MISNLDTPDSSRGDRLPGRLVLGALLVSIAALVGCNPKQEDATASQPAAKVNKEEITVAQINFVLQQQRGLKPEQTEAASRQILQRLIDQELAFQKAQEIGLDRDPRVLQLLEAARREIVARAYDRIHLLDLRRADVTVAVREMFDGSIALGRAALAALDTDSETIAAIEAEFRSRDAERLALQLVSGDQLSGVDRLFRPGSVFVPDALGEIPFEEAPAD